jgi:C4-dicarboxylate transporter DctM subunit
MMTACFLVSYIRGWGHMIPFSLVNSGRLALKAYLGFMAIGLVIYGIYSGAFSPTEAAGMTVGFCLLAGVLITREISLRKLPEVLLRSGQITGILAPLIAVSVVMQQILSLLGAGEAVAGWLTGMGGYYTILFTSMAMVLVAGMVLESLPVTIILAPILAPIAIGVGVDPVHFAVIFLVGAAIGFVTPPFGLNLYVASSITGIPYFRLLGYTIPYLIALLGSWFITALWPPLTMFMVTFGGQSG